MTSSPPQVALPPGYSWQQKPTGVHNQMAWYVVDPSGKGVGIREGNTSAVQGLWDQYNAATEGGGFGGSPLTLQQLGTVGELQKYQAEEGQRNLKDLEEQYYGAEQDIGESFTEAAKRAGTYANTPEFLQGLMSDVQAGTRGAQASILARINAIRKALGQPEFTPEASRMQQFNIGDFGGEDEAAVAPVDTTATAPTERPERPERPEPSPRPTRPEGPTPEENKAPSEGEETSNPRLRPRPTPQPSRMTSLRKAREQY